MKIAPTLNDRCAGCGSTRSAHFLGRLSRGHPFYEEGESHPPTTRTRREETHCPKCDGVDLFTSSSVEGGFLCRNSECGYGFVDRRAARS